MENNLSEKINIAIERLIFGLEQSKRLYGQPLAIAFSGGKDSLCLYGLSKLTAERLNKTLEEVGSFFYKNTSVDPPELVHFIREKYPFVKEITPKKTMWELIELHKMAPTRFCRYCCLTLKEVNEKKIVLATGVRWAESVKRKKTRADLEVSQKSHERRQRLRLDNEEDRRGVENCMKFNQFIINPIIDWKDDDVWDFIHSQKLEYCKLYDEGFNRLGCIGCPLTSKKVREMQFKRYPKYKIQYIKTLDKAIKAYGKSKFKSGEEYFSWWLNQ